RRSASSRSSHRAFARPHKRPGTSAAATARWQPARTSGPPLETTDAVPVLTWASRECYAARRPGAVTGPPAPPAAEAMGPAPHWQRRPAPARVPAALGDANRWRFRCGERRDGPPRRPPERRAVSLEGRPPPWARPP